MIVVVTIAKVTVAKVVFLVFCSDCNSNGNSDSSNFVASVRMIAAVVT